MLIGAMEIFFPGFFLAPVVAVPEEPHPMFRASTGLGALLAASWCVAISGGYKIPAFFAVPLVFSLFVLHWRMGGNAGRLAWIVLAAGLVMFRVGYQYPYTFPARPLQRSDMTYDAGKIYPRASHVLVDKDMYERLAELKTLVESLEIPVYFAALGASNAVGFQGRLPEDREELLSKLGRACETGSEAALRQYRENLRHL